MKKLARSSAIAGGTLFLGSGVVVGSFMQFSPQFGAPPTDEQMIEYDRTGHHRDGVFLNAKPINMEVNCHSIGEMLKEMTEPDPNLAPPRDVDVLPLEPSTIGSLPKGQTRVTWLGHSTFIVEIEGLVLLLDPVFGDYPAPVPIPGRRRYSAKMPIELGDIPRVDAVIISHDHYDHLEYEAMAELRGVARAFMVPLGVGNHLRRWNVDPEKIRELDWWQEAELDGLRFAFTPSRHMSGRGFTDQSATLWGSWALLGTTHRMYFSGDGGYGPHFAEIGARYGPFDFGLMECGQYNDLWRGVHMTPEETVDAGMDVRAAQILPIHWGAFSLASHAWTDPIERVTKAAAEAGLPIATPRIGQSLVLGQGDLPRERWWEAYARAEN